MAQPRDREQRDELDISAMPELRRVAEEVARSGRVRVLTENGKVVARVVPEESGPSADPDERRQTLLAAAGTWDEVDDEALIARIYADRDRPHGESMDFSTFLSSAGGWADVDTEELINNIYASRDGSFQRS